MTMLAEVKESRALSLADYEARIHLYKEQIGTGYIGIGRTLIEAKEAKVVPHGEWEDWVTRTTGLTPRQAQRCMQAATEIKDGSALARLEMSKALMLLSSGLEDEQKEEIARKAEEEGATVKALREEIRTAKLKLVQETGTVSEIREELKKVRSEREGMERQLKATIEAYQKRMDEECGKAYRRGVEEKATGLEKEIRKEFQEKIDYINGERVRLDEARRELQAKLDDAERAGSARWDEGFSRGKAQAEEETQKRIAGLRNELNKQTQYAEELRAKLEETEGEIAAERKRFEEDLTTFRRAHWNELQEQDALTRENYEGRIEQLTRNQADLLAAAEEAEKRAADAEAELEALRAGQTESVPAGVALGKAASAFFSECELMPFYPEQLRKDAGAIRHTVEQIADWCRRMTEALGGDRLEAEGAVV